MLNLFLVCDEFDNVLLGHDLLNFPEQSIDLLDRPLNLVIH